MILTENQKDILGERVLDQLPRIQRSQNLTEMQKLECIGKIVDGTILDLRSRYQEIPQPVTPSILPEADDITIGKMALWQKNLKNSGKSTEEQEIILDDLFRQALRLQKEERP